MPALRAGMLGVFLAAFSGIAHAADCHLPTAIDPCLIGQWDMDRDSLAGSYMGGWRADGRKTVG